MSDTRIIRITPSKAFAPGKMSFDMDLLPRGYRIDAAFIELDGTLNVPAAGLTSDQQTRLLQLVESERRLRIDGLGLSTLDWHMSGKDFVRPADIAVNAAAPVNMVWPIGWRDERGIEPGDAPPATDFYRNKTLDAYWSVPTDILAALAVNAGTVCQVTFHLSPMPAGYHVPASTVFGFMEYIGKETKLPAGQYLDLFIQKLDGAAITDAELGNVSLKEDGRLAILENVRLRQLVRSFNRWVARGAQVQGATNGVEGEALDEASVPFASLLHPQRPYKGTKLPTAFEVLNLTIDGNLAPGSARVYYRLIELRDKENVKRAGARLGYPPGEPFPKTASKRGVAEVRGFLSGMAARIVPH